MLGGQLLRRQHYSIYGTTTIVDRQSGLMFLPGRSGVRRDERAAATRGAGRVFPAGEGHPGGHPDDPDG